MSFEDLNTGMESAVAGLAVSGEEHLRELDQDDGMPTYLPTYLPTYNSSFITRK